MENKNSNLNAIYAKKTANTHKRVDEAITALMKAGKAINFNSVAKISGLSKTTLYNNMDIRNRISSLSLSAKSESSMQKRMLSDNNKDSVIDALKRKISTLEAENKALKTQLECAYERYYDKL